MMKNQKNKLEEIEPKHIYKVPERYFDLLAAEIQAKTTSATVERPGVRLPVVVRYALPVLVLIVMTIFWTRQYTDDDPSKSVEQLIAEIPAEGIIDYLESSDMTWTEIADIIDEEGIMIEQYDINPQDSLSSEEIEALLQDYEPTGEYL